MRITLLTGDWAKEKKEETCRKMKEDGYAIYTFPESWLHTGTYEGILNTVLLYAKQHRKLVVTTPFNSRLEHAKWFFTKKGAQVSLMEEKDAFKK